MLWRLRYGRRLQIYCKFIGCILVAAFYFTVLFRESLNAFEQKKDRPGVANTPAGGSSVSSVSGKSELYKHKRQLKPPDTAPPLTVTAAASTLNPVYEYSEEIHSAIERDLKRRSAHLNDVCRRYKLQSRYPPNPWEFFISPGHNLVWCNVFKAASSTWMYYFNILGGYNIKFLQHTRMQPLELARKCFPRPEISELLESLPSSLSFLFVRDPFERIVSAYRNKLEGGRNSFYKALGRKIIQEFRKRPSNAPKPKSGPTFEEFLHYLIRQHELGNRFDEHWAPVYSFCTPCSVNFTIIGKVETFQRDSEFIVRMGGLESLLLGKLPKNKLTKIGNLAKGVQSNALVERYIAEIDRDTLDQLLKIYRLDFELFDYDYTKYYDVVQTPSETTSSVNAHANASWLEGGALHAVEKPASATTANAINTTTSTTTSANAAATLKASTTQH